MIWLLLQHSKYVVIITALVSELRPNALIANLPVCTCSAFPLHELVAFTYSLQSVLEPRCSIYLAISTDTNWWSLLQNEAIPKVNTFNLFMNLNSASVATCDLLARWTAASDWNIWSYPSTVYNTTIVSCLRPAYFTDMMATSKWYEKQKFKQNKANKYCNLNQNCSKKTNRIDNWVWLICSEEMTYTPYY